MSKPPHSSAPPTQQERMPDGGFKGSNAAAAFMSKMESVIQDLQSKMESVIQDLQDGDPQQVMALVVGFLIGLITLALIFSWRRSKSRGRTVILSGTCESGKTAMFARLVHGKLVETYTSAKENLGMLRTCEQ
jgi:hypothetical protein